MKPKKQALMQDAEAAFARVQALIKAGMTTQAAAPLYAHAMTFNAAAMDKHHGRARRALRELRKALDVAEAKAGGEVIGLSHRRCPKCQARMRPMPPGIFSCTMRCAKCDSSVGMCAVSDETSLVHDGAEP